MTDRFYDAIGLACPDSDHRVRVAASDLPRLRGRLLAAGAQVEELGRTSLAFSAPDGVRVELVGQPPLDGTRSPAPQNGVRDIS
jgi:hypothetical protein